MAVQGKLVGQIVPADIRELIEQRYREDGSIDFKQTIFHPLHRRPNEDIDDILADLAAFANASGGHIVIGIEDRDHRAHTLRPHTEAEARRIAVKLRDLAAAHINPRIPQLEIVPFAMDNRQQDWVVIVAIQESQDKPHMSAFLSRCRFPKRVGDGKREMTYHEIQNAFLTGPQQATLARFVGEIEAIKSLLSEVLRSRSPLRSRLLDFLRRWASRKA